MSLTACRCNELDDHKINHLYDGTHAIDIAQNMYVAFMSPAREGENEDLYKCNTCSKSWLAFQYYNTDKGLNADHPRTGYYTWLKLLTAREVENILEKDKWPDYFDFERQRHGGFRPVLYS